MRWMMGAVAAMCLCGPASAMTLTSADFKDGAALPTEHIYPRCGGQNVSPELSWSGVPQGTQSFVLTFIDMTVKPNGWSHWIVVNLPSTVTSLAHGLQALPTPAEAIASNFGDKFYDGPCPPPGTGTHRYEFTIWAMPNKNGVFSFPDDMPANALRSGFEKLSIDHATIAASVTAK